MKPKETIAAFDAYLADRGRGLSLDAVIIGGAALGLLGIISRETRDCDVLFPALSDAIREASRDFAGSYRRQGHDLVDDWLNDKPSSLIDVLLHGWRDHLRSVFEGRVVTLKTLSRADLLRSKLFALCDRALDLQDCIELAPTNEELLEIIPWLEEQDGNPDWPEHVRRTLADLQERLKDGV
jgi:hypothetical protein